MGAIQLPSKPILFINRISLLLQHFYCKKTGKLEPQKNMIMNSTGQVMMLFKD